MQDHSRFTSVLKDLNWAPLKDRRRDIRLTMLFKTVKCNMPVHADAILLPADPRIRHHHSFKFKHILSHTAQYKHSFLLEQYLSGTLFLKPASTRSRGYCQRILDAAPSHALSGVHTTPIVVIRESGLTIIELELELEPVSQ